MKLIRSFTLADGLVAVEEYQHENPVPPGLPGGIAVRVTGRPPDDHHLMVERLDNDKPYIYQLWYTFGDGGIATHGGMAAYGYRGLIFMPQVGPVGYVENVPRGVKADTVTAWLRDKFVPIAKEHGPLRVLLTFDGFQVAAVAFGKEFAWQFLGEDEWRILHAARLISHGCARTPNSHTTLVQGLVRDLSRHNQPTEHGDADGNETENNKASVNYFALENQRRDKLRQHAEAERQVMERQAVARVKMIDRFRMAARDQMSTAETGRAARVLFATLRSGTIREARQTLSEMHEGKLSPEMAREFEQSFGRSAATSDDQKMFPSHEVLRDAKKMAERAGTSLPSVASTPLLDEPAAVLAAKRRTKHLAETPMGNNPYVEDFVCKLSQAVTGHPNAPGPNLTAPITPDHLADALRHVSTQGRTPVAVVMNRVDYADIRKWGRGILDIECRADVLRFGLLARFNITDLANVAIITWRDIQPGTLVVVCRLADQTLTCFDCTVKRDATPKVNKGIISVEPMPAPLSEIFYRTDDLPGTGSKNLITEHVECDPRPEVHYIDPTR